jgi:hypothetical protein
MADKRTFKAPVNKRQLINDKVHWDDGTWGETAFRGLQRRMDPAGYARDRRAQWLGSKAQEQALLPDYGLMSMPKDLAAGVGQYAAGEVLGALELDPFSLAANTADATGVSVPYLAAAGGLLASGSKLRQLGRAAAKEATAVARRAPMGQAAIVSDAIKRTGAVLEPDVVKGLKSAKKGKGKTTSGVVNRRNVDQKLVEAAEGRGKLREEPMPFDKPISQMTDDELTAIGEKYGVNMRPSPMMEVEDPGTGRKYMIPGGLKTPFSYTDLHQLKAQAYNPRNMSDAFQARIQRRLLDATTPQNMDHYELLNRTMFGMQSPNTPLGQNLFMTARMRARTPEDIERLASYTKGKNFTKAQRKEVDAQMGRDYGIGAAYTGGMGVRSSADLTNVSELAAKMQTNPDFLKKTDDYTWKEFTERLFNSMRGLSAKTGSFGGVWQNPGKADISAMDRHMARKFLPEVLADPVLGPEFKDNVLSLYNKPQKKGSKRPKVNTFEDLLLTKKGEEFVADQVVTFSTRKTGGQWDVVEGKGANKTVVANPNTPAHLKDLPFRASGKYSSIGDLYQKMLDTNRASAEQQNLSVFGEQWRIWDRIRKSLEPHEVMAPGLHKLPALSAGELVDARNVHSGAGFFGTGARRPYDWRKGLYWSVPTMGLLGIPQNEDQAPAGSMPEQ